MPREKFQNLTEPMFYTLLCLHRPAYGAEIMEQVAALTGGAVRLGPWHAVPPAGRVPRSRADYRK